MKLYSSPRREEMKVEASSSTEEAEREAF